MLLGAPLTDADKQIIDLQKLLAAVTALDFSKAKEGTILETLESLFPHIPRNKLEAIQNEVSKALQARHKEIQAKRGKKSNFYLKLTFSIAAVIGGYYFGGPIAVKLTNSALNRIYILLFGIPHPQSLTYSILAPCQKFLTYISATYGPYFFASTAGPATYTAASAFESLYNSMKYLSEFVRPSPRALPVVLPKTIEELAEDLRSVHLASETCDEEDRMSEFYIGEKRIEIFHNYKPASIPNDAQSVQARSLRQQHSEYVSPVLK